MASISRTLTKLRPATAQYSASSKHLPPSSYFSTATPAVSSVPEPSSKPPSPSQSAAKEGGPSWTRWLLFLPGGITFGLGTWQIVRRQEKIKTLEYRHERLRMEPLKFNDVPPSSENLDTLECRRALCKGVFDEENSVFIGPRSRSISGVTENGYYVITPLKPISNDPESLQSPVLVNRGWVPRSWKERALGVQKDVEQPSSKQTVPIPESEKSHWWKFWSSKPENVEVELPAITPVEVIGVVRGSEKPSIFVPANDPKSNQWFYIDIPAIAHACGLPEDTLYMEDVNENINPSNPYPVPKDINTLIRSSVMPQDHLNYTLTWYSLSAAVTYMAIKRLKQKKRR